MRPRSNTFTSDKLTEMRKSVLLFFLLIAAIFLLKLNMAVEEDELKNTTVEELVSETEDTKIANK